MHSQEQWISTGFIHNNIFLKAEQYAEQYATDDDIQAKPEADGTKEDQVTVDIDSDHEQAKATHPQTKFT